MSAFTDAEIEYLRGQQLGRLASAQPNGTIQNNPVGYGYNSALDTIDIGGHNMSASRKFRNVEAGSVVAFVVDDIVSVSPWRVRMLEIRGTAEALSAPADSEAHMPGPIIRIHRAASSATTSCRTPAAAPERVTISIFGHSVPEISRHSGTVASP